VRYQYLFYMVRQGDGPFLPERAFGGEYPSSTNLADLERMAVEPLSKVSGTRE
jgi:hypothetical protein